MAISISDVVKTYVDENKSGLIKKAVLAPKSAKLFNLLSGVKGSTSLNLLDTAIVFGDGSQCGWNEQGTSTISQRVLVPGYPKVNQSFCDKQLLKYWLNQDVKIAAGIKTLPAEEDFINGVIAAVGAALEKEIWLGDATGSTTNLNNFNGVEKVIEGTNFVAAEYAATATTSEAIMGVYEKIPAECFTDGKKVVMYVGSDMYRKYIQELVASKSIILNGGSALANVAMPEDILIPGTNVVVTGVDGLIGTNDIYCSYADNFVYGTDLQGDEEKFEFWYSQDNREFRMVVEFSAGVQIAYPQFLVKGYKAA